MPSRKGPTAPRVQRGADAIPNHAAMAWGEAGSVSSGCAGRRRISGPRMQEATQKLRDRGHYRRDGTELGRLTRSILAPIALLALVSSVHVRGAGAAPNDFYDRLQAARALAAEGDLVGARKLFMALDREEGGHASSIWNLARIDARRGDGEAAVRALEEFAGMGLAGFPSRDSSFTVLADYPRYLAVELWLAKNAVPLANASVAHRLHDAVLLPEDLAFDAGTRTLYVSSIHRRKVIAIDSAGVLRDFIPPAQNGIWGVYGLALDAPRGLLWGSMAAGPTCDGFDPADSGRTALVGWDLNSGVERLRVELPRDGGRHVLGDITLGKDGTVFATESVGGGLFALRPDAGTLDTLAAPGTFGSPQSPVALPGGDRLLVADYPRGIMAFDLATGSVSPFPKPRSLAATGIDGLTLVPRDGAPGLLAVQNGTQPRRLLWLSLDADMTRITGWKVLEQASPALGEPNHAIVVGDDAVLIGNSGWERVNGRDELETGPDDVPPAILRIRVDAK